jgi:hypothetical protein
VLKGWRQIEQSRRVRLLPAPLVHNRSGKPSATPARGSCSTSQTQGTAAPSACAARNSRLPVHHGDQVQFLATRCFWCGRGGASARAAPQPNRHTRRFSDLTEWGMISGR